MIRCALGSCAALTVACAHAATTATTPRESAHPSATAIVTDPTPEPSDPVAPPLVDASPARSWKHPHSAQRRVPAGVDALPESTPALPLPEGTTVLHIGDSFAGALGIALNREFELHGVHGLLRYRTASYIPTWAFDEEVPRIVQSYHPQLVLITLGANEVEITEPEQRVGAIKRLVRALAGRPCVWIAPPLWHADNGLMRVIRDNCAPCRFMDTNAYIPMMPRVKDGIHPSMEARGMWAKVVLDWLTRERRPTPTEPWALRAGP